MLNRLANERSALELILRLVGILTAVKETPQIAAVPEVEGVVSVANRRGVYIIVDYLGLMHQPSGARNRLTSRSV